MKAIIMYYSPKCHFCKLAKLRLKQLLPEDRAIFINADSVQKNTYSDFAKSKGLPCMFIVSKQGDKIVFGTNPDDEKELLYCRGYKEPLFTDFIGTQMYNTSGFFKLVQNKEITKQECYSRMKENDQLV